MGLTHDDQFKKILSSASHILIVLPQNPTGDMIGAGLGLAHFCYAMGLDVTVAYKNLSGAREMYDFLPQPENVVHTLEGSRDFTMTFKTAHNDITSVRSERTDDAVLVHVTPARGMIESRDFSFGLAEFPYNVMIAIGAQDKKAFGTLLSEIPDILYDVPVVNIDNKSANEQFGQLNIVTLTASSLSEMITRLCAHISHEHITPDVAQCLLTGIISATDSFRDPATTPNALTLSSMLIDHGADQHAIVTHLYKSQPLSLLKLWGRALAKLEVHTSGAIISTLITRQDFIATHTDVHYLPQIIDKIKKNHTQAKFFIIIHEALDDADGKNDKKCVALIDATRHGDLPEETFGMKEESGLYETTFRDGDCATGREKLATLIEEILKKQ